MKILVADDEPTSLRIMEALLAPLGEVKTARNGSGAVALFRLAIETGDPFDLVCLDIEMPGMNGQFALRQIRKLEDKAGIAMARRAKVVMATAHQDAKSVLSAFREQADGFVVKPVDRKQLLSTLNAAGIHGPQ